MISALFPDGAITVNGTTVRTAFCTRGGGILLLYVDKGHRTMHNKYEGNER